MMPSPLGLRSTTVMPNALTKKSAVAAGSRVVIPMCLILGMRSPFLSCSSFGFSGSVDVSSVRLKRASASGDVERPIGHRQRHPRAALQVRVRQPKLHLDTLHRHVDVARRALPRLDLADDV